MNNWPQWYFQAGSGIWWVRVFGVGLQLKSPAYEPLFSERYGYVRPLIRFRGWRIFWLPRIE